VVLHWLQGFYLTYRAQCLVRRNGCGAHNMLTEWVCRGLSLSGLLRSRHETDTCYWLPWSSEEVIQGRADADPRPFRRLARRMVTDVVRRWQGALTWDKECRKIYYRCVGLEGLGGLAVGRTLWGATRQWQLECYRARALLKVDAVLCGLSREARRCVRGCLGWWVCQFEDDMGDYDHRHAHELELLWKERKLVV